jgi:chromosomal replication initiation ATPase DnaA
MLRILAPAGTLLRSIELLGKIYRFRVDGAQFAAGYFGRRKCGLRLAELGAAVGGADYAAVSAAIKRFERRLSREHSLQNSVESLSEMLNVES